MSSSSSPYGTLPPESKSNMITIDAAVERLGYGRFQLKVMLAAGLSFAADAMEVMALSFLSIVLQSQWNLSSRQTAILTSIVFLGQFLGTLTLGPLGDKIGRKPVFLLSASIIAIFGLATAVCNSYIALVLTRMFVGFGVGGLVVPFDCMAELLPIVHRGRDLLFIEYFWTFGTLMVPLAAKVTLDTNDENGWRWFVVLCALPCIVSTCIGWFLVPESPRWLLTQGRGDEALAVLRKGAAANGLDASVVFPEGIMLEPEEPEASSVKELFTKQWKWITIFLWITWFGFAFLYYGTILATTVIFSDSNTDLGESGSFEFDYGAILISGSAEIFGTTLAIFTVDWIGRRLVQMFSYGIGGCAILLLGILANNNTAASTNTLVVVSFVARMMMMTGNITTWVATAEILTTEIRATGHSYANALARVGGFCAPYLVQDTTPVVMIGAIMFGVAIVTTLSSSRLPETKGKGLGVHLNNSQDELELQKPEGSVI